MSRPNIMGKPNLGSKPSMMMKVKKKDYGPPMQTPVKYDQFQNGAQQHDNGAPPQNGVGTNEEIQMSPPESAYQSGANQMPMTTPPAGPSASRLKVIKPLGVGQTAKPMMKFRKKMVMDTPERQENIPFMQKLDNSQQQQSLHRGTPNLQVPGAYGNGGSDREGSGNRLHHTPSKGSLGGSDSQQRLVEDKQLGPEKLKHMKGTAVPRDQWKGSSENMLAGGNVVLSQHQRNQNVAINKISQGPMRPQSRMKANVSSQNQARVMNTSANKALSKYSNESDEDYDNDDFDNNPDPNQDVQQMLRNKMARDNQRAQAYNERQIHRERQEQQNKHQFQAKVDNNPLQKDRVTGGFMKQKEIQLVGQVSHQTVNRQKARAKELRELLQLNQDEVFNMLDMAPMTPIDIYQKKYQAGAIDTQVCGTHDELIDQDPQTDPLEYASVECQKPEHVDLEKLMQNYKEHQKKIHAIGIRKGKNADLGNVKLQNFLDSAGPVMQKVLEESQQAQFKSKQNREDAKNRNAVELKQTIHIPQEILHLFSEESNNNQPTLAQIKKISCIHTFESCPQSKIAIAYVLQRPTGGLVYLAVVYSTLKKPPEHSNILVCNEEITQMCTTGRADLMVCATILGSFYLFDLLNIQETDAAEMELNFEAVIRYKKPDYEKYPIQVQQELKNKCYIKYNVQSYSYMTDGLETFPHSSQIQKLSFININESGTSKIGAIDKHGIISVWSVNDHIDIPGSNLDLNVKTGSKYKMVQIFSDKLFQYRNVIDLYDEKSLQYLELEFDPIDPQLYFISSSLGLFKIHRNDEIRTEPAKMDTIGLNSPTALSLCDKGFLLAAFSCGSICMYDKNYTSPLTVWYQKTKSPITQIKWCQLYFDEDTTGASKQSPSKSPLKSKQEDKDEPDNKTASKGEQFTARLCEFFAIDLSEDFSIWNLQKSTKKPAHVIQFSEKHNSHDVKRMFRISTTCWDQSFFTAFALKDFSVNLYLMNFKKGSSITKDKLSNENKKSLKVIKSLPSNLLSEYQGVDLDFDFAQIQTD